LQQENSIGKDRTNICLQLKHKQNTKYCLAKSVLYKVISREITSWDQFSRTATEASVMRILYDY